MILEVENLNYSYKDGDGDRLIFKDVSIGFEKGKFYALLGESGSGKTTFLSIIGGQDKRYSGRVLFNGEDISKIGFEKYRRSGVATIYQNYNLIPYLTAIENIVIGMDISENVKKIDFDKVNSVLTSLGITEDKRNRKVSSLSGGEQQRIAVARCLLTESPIIVADEPTGNLDAEASNELMKLFRSIVDQQNRCIIMVTHNELLTKQIDVVYRINQKEKTIETY